MVVTKVLLGAEGPHAGHLDQAIGAWHKPNLAWGHHATAHIYGSALGAHVLGAQNRLATQFAYVVLRRDVAAATHIDQAIAVIEDGKRRGFAVHGIELAQRLRTHQKANAATAHGRNAALKIGDASHIGKLIEHKLHATLQMAAGAGIGTALGNVKLLLKGNIRKPCISRIVVAHLKIDHALALVNTIKTHLVILKNAHELRRLKPRDSCIERDQNTL